VWLQVNAADGFFRRHAAGLLTIRPGVAIEKPCVRRQLNLPPDDN
jgi:hypothetical protein